MRQFVESLARLYKEHKIEREKILSFLERKVITKSEFDYILGE